MKRFKILLARTITLAYIGSFTAAAIGFPALFLVALFVLCTDAKPTTGAVVLVIGVSAAMTAIIALSPLLDKVHLWEHPEDDLP